MAHLQLKELIEKVVQGVDLETEEAAAAAAALASAKSSLDDKKAFLLALAEKGEKAHEVSAFAKVFRGLARDPHVDDYAQHAIDIVGTGGDKSHSFNISTTSAFLVAASGIPVFKHGNRSVTSSCGSADLQAAIGIKLEVDDGFIKRSLNELSYIFFFAPAFHPAFKEIVPVRKALAAEGKRTIFNILGPLINPGQPGYQLMGVFSEAWVEPLAKALHDLGLRRGVVVHCDLGEGVVMDELSTAGVNRVVGFGSLSHINTSWTAEDFGLPVGNYAELKGGSVEDNVALLEAFVEGKAPQSLTNSILLNAGTAFWITQRADSVEAGVRRAEEILKNGQLSKWLNKVKTFYSK